MSPHIVTSRRISLPPRLTRIDQEGFDHFVAWGRDAKTLKDVVIDPVTEVLKALSTYGRENRPSDSATETFEVGGYNVGITTSTRFTQATPAYGDVYAKFEKYVRVLLEQHSEPARRDGVRKIEDQSYVDISVIIKVLDKYIQAAFKQAGIGGVQQKVDILNAKEMMPSVLEFIDIVFGGPNYKAATETAVEALLRATLMVAEGTRRVEEDVDESGNKTPMFKKLLLVEGLEMIKAATGGKPLERTPIEYPFADRTYWHQIEPRSRPKYVNIISEFNKEPPEDISKIRTNTRIGDLVVLARRHADDEFREKVEAKGLVEPLMQDYGPVVLNDGRLFISIQGILNRLEAYKEKHSTHTYEQNIFVANNIMGISATGHEVRWQTS